MKCMFQDCSLEATKTVPCELGMSGEPIDAHVCKIHHALLFNDSVNVSMELKNSNIRRDMEKQYFIKHDLNKPCSFCESFEERHDENHIYKDEDGQFNIMADTGDSFQWGIIEDVNYCPYCGRRLAND